MKIISTTKSIFGNKVVRLIFFLLVIGGILTGVAFGIIALTRSLKNPCTTDPTRPIYDLDSKACVPDCGKKKICNNPKAYLYQKCPLDNYCTGDYIYDKNSCQCTIKCGSGLEPFTKDGLSSTTEMKKDPNGNYTPVNQLTCGIPCHFSTKKYCTPPLSCGQSIYTDGSHEGNGCYSNNDYTKCPRSDIYCLGSGKNLCTSTSEGEKCKLHTCGFNNTTQGVACTSDIECNKSSKIQSKIQSKCVKNNNKILNGKHITDIGVCDGDTTILQNSPNCMDVNKIGENKDGDIINCGTNIGISNIISQCKSSVIAGTPISATPGVDPKGCAAAICSSTKNNWQALSKGANKSTCQKIGPSPNVKMTGGNCCMMSGEAANYPTNQGNTLMSEKICCGRKVNSGQEFCSNNTLYPYSGLFLGEQSMSWKEPITLSKGVTEKSQIENYNKKLWAQLNISQSEGGDPTNSKYSGTYFAPSTTTGDTVLHAYCGNYTPTGGSPKLSVVNNSNDEISYCVSKGKCTLGDLSYDNGTSGPDVDQNGWPLCTKGGGKSGTLYWSDPFPKGGEPLQIKQTTFGKSCNDQNLTQECANLSTMITGMNTATISGGECIFQNYCKDINMKNENWGQLYSNAENATGVNAWNNAMKPYKILLNAGNNVSGSCPMQASSFPGSITEPVLTWDDTNCEKTAYVDQPAYLTTGEYCPFGVMDPRPMTDNVCKPPPPPPVIQNSPN